MNSECGLTYTPAGGACLTYRPARRVGFSELLGRLHGHDLIISSATHKESGIAG